MNDLVALRPEDLDLANAYLEYGSAREVSDQLGIPYEVVVSHLDRTDVKNYLNNVYLDRGFRNRNKIAEVMDRIIDSKLEEAIESGMYSSKDLLDILALAHKMRMEEIKMSQGQESNSPVVQIANFGGGNYGQLMEKLLK